MKKKGKEQKPSNPSKNTPVAMLTTAFFHQYFKVLAQNPRITWNMYLYFYMQSQYDLFRGYKWKNPDFYMQMD